MKEQDVNSWDKAIRRRLYEAEMAPPSYVQHDLFKKVQDDFSVVKPLGASSSRTNLYPYAAAAAACLLFLVFFLKPDQLYQELRVVKPVSAGPPEAVVQTAGAAEVVLPALVPKQPKTINKMVEQSTFSQPEQTPANEPLVTFHQETETAYSAPRETEEQERIEAVQQNFMLRIADTQAPANNSYEPVEQSYRLPVVFLEKEQQRLLKDFPPRRSNFPY